MMNRLDKYYEAHPQQLMRRTHNTTLMLPPPPLVDAPPVAGSASRSSTWTTYHSKGGFSVLERGERIKPERSNRRNNVQKMQWRSSRWVTGFPCDDADLDGRISSMTIADVSPRFAVKRIILLYENFQYREAANFINRLSHGTFKVILNDLPVDLFVESMPHSLSILEALYAKVFLSDGLNFSMKLLRPEAVIMQMVKFFSCQEKVTDWELCGPFICSCKKLLKVIVLSDPKLKKILQSRRRTLDKAIEGLGQHGLVGTTDQTLMNLHDALKVEFQRVVETYKGALQKLEDLSLASSKSSSRGPAPVESSHQRQLSLKQPEIQERLIKNKTLLNVVEPTLGNHSLDILLGILQRRIDHDKDVLFQFTQLRKEMKEVDAAAVVAPVLMRFSHGCDQVLELMKEMADDEGDSSDISGYHSDSDSAIMMSGNSPFVSKRARCNFLTRSVRSSSKCSVRTSVLLHPQLQACSSGSDSPPSSLGACDKPHDACSTASDNSAHKKLHSQGSTGSVTCCQGCQPRASLQVLPPSPDQEVAALRAEMEALRAELNRANTRLHQFQDPPPGDRAAVADPDLSRRLVRCYGNLYTSARVDTLDSLDGLAPLRDAHELKSKILFSVIVLSFRSAQSLLALKKDHVRRVLHVVAPDPQGPAQGPIVEQLETSVELYLRRTMDVFDLSKSVEEVLSQIWATLYDYPCLKTCPGLVQYVKDAVRLAWGLVNQDPRPPWNDSTACILLAGSKASRIISPANQYQSSVP